MPLAALLIAGDRPGHAILGTPRIDFLLRRAQAAGASHAVIYTERVTEAILASAMRLRQDGIGVDIARTAADAAERIHPDESVLLISRDLVVAPARLSMLAGANNPTLLCVADDSAHADFELIDAATRWTGYARIDGEMLRRTVAMVGDWDLGSTLLRRAVQGGAQRLTLTAEQAGQDLTIASTAAAAQVAGRKLIAQAPAPVAGWTTHWLLTPAGRAIARISGEAGVEARWLSQGGLALLAMAVLSALAGWIVASLALLVLGYLLDQAGAIGAVAGAGAPPHRWRRHVRPLAAAIVGVATGITLFMRTMQWGCIVLALVLVGASWLAATPPRDERRFVRWRGDPAGYALIGLAGFAGGFPVIALAAAAAHAALWLAWTLRTDAKA